MFSPVFGQSANRIFDFSGMKSFLDGYHTFLRWSITALMGLMIIPVFLQVLSRFLGIIPRYIWTEEVARFCFVWIIMIGSMIAVRDSSHFDVDLIPRPKRFRSQGILQLIRHIAMLALAGIFLCYGIDFAKFGFAQNSEMSGINMLSIYICFPLAGLSWILFLGEKIYQDIRVIRGDPDPKLRL